MSKQNKSQLEVKCLKGDAMTLLAFDMKEIPTGTFVGFTVHVQTSKKSYYLTNRLSFKDSILVKNQISDQEKFSSLYSPYQKFRWVHAPSGLTYTENPEFGEYIYTVSPRYLEKDILIPIDDSLSVIVKIAVSPFEKGNLKLGFTRAFISSQAYTYYFGNESKLRPNKSDLIFDIDKISGSAVRWNKVDKEEIDTPYTFREQHNYLGWQAKDRIIEFLGEVVKNTELRLEVFAYDLNEPTIIGLLIDLAEQGRIDIILDDYPNHIEEDCWEMKFEKLFKKKMHKQSTIFRGHFASQAHSKVFIQRDVKKNQAVKVLTGSTNFTTNGLYVNANHVLIFNDPEVAEIYSKVFWASNSKGLMKAFNESTYAMSDHIFKKDWVPDMTIRFSPHSQAKTLMFFKEITDRILNAKSDVLFAVMIDSSNSSILDALKSQITSDKVFSYGITDETDDVILYVPGSRKGVKVSGIGTKTDLPKPFRAVAKIPGHNIHHKFVVVDFKGENPVVYCGSSNLAFGPEQKNGDNLLEIRDKDVVTAFAIEAIRLIDHYHWRNRKEEALESSDSEKVLNLKDGSEAKKWFESYYDQTDLHYVERTLLIRD
ncbi:phospholipase D-like domain-containing protein [Pedobacter mendelii]|uniref:phospholipase D n=1 Tax=Pedobacter mendelii TaxID=1908240 RepID=A0ABQ2BGT0_9SPHI|nr:phospholipase D-like domain-containing protein [Pedobacter mendelii]GGI23880.1 hypothetical protein GCM10008119_09870 [Pedobacter mendelii]